MTCGEFEEIVHGLTRMELLDLASREAALDHAGICRSCATRMAEAESLAEVSEAAAKAFHGEETPSRVAIVLLAAFREQHRRRTYWRRTLKWAALGAAAAGLLIVGWVSYPRWKAFLSSAPDTAVVSYPAASGGNHLGSPRASNIQSAKEKSLRVAGRGESDWAADFVPAPFGEGVKGDDAGIVLRVELTPAALGALGYPVDEVYAEGWIHADVLVGEDGWPRAVRLVR